MAEPVTLAEAKAQVRMVEDDSEDTFIESLIAPARARVERVSGYSFVAGSRTAAFSRWGDYLELYHRPVTGITTVTYGSDGTGTEYEGQVNLSSYPVRIYPAADGSGFPELADGETIIVTYTVGAVASTSEEYLIGKRAMLLLIGFWFDNRGEVPLSKDAQLAFTGLMDDLRPLSAY